MTRLLRESVVRESNKSHTRESPRYAKEYYVVTLISANFLLLAKDGDRFPSEKVIRQQDVCTDPRFVVEPRERSTISYEFMQQRIVLARSRLPSARHRNGQRKHIKRTCPRHATLPPGLPGKRRRGRPILLSGCDSAL